MKYIRIDLYTQFSQYKNESEEALCYFQSGTFLKPFG